MSESEDSERISQETQIHTDRKLSPTCQWCGTNNSSNWKDVIATGKFYCSDDCRNAAYYQFYFAIAILSLISLPTSIIAYFQSPVGELRDFMMWVFYMSIIGAVGGIAYTWESKRIRAQISKNSKRMRKSELE